MTWLIGCEFSGTLRDAAIRKGIDAVSVDLLPSETPGPHIQDDLRNHLDKAWQGAVIFPPCTRLSQIGVRWLHERDLWKEMEEACLFFMQCLAVNAPKVAVENPTMHRYARTIIRRNPHFAVHPYMFGDEWKKRTCFWTYGLRRLEPTHNPDPMLMPSIIQAVAGTRDNWKVRSRLSNAMAEAIVDQWMIR